MAGFTTTWKITKHKFRLIEANIKTGDQLIGKVGIEIALDIESSKTATPCPVEKQNAPKNAPSDNQPIDTMVCSNESDSADCRGWGVGHKTDFFDDCNGRTCASSKTC